MAGGRVRGEVSDVWAVFVSRDQQGEEGQRGGGIVRVDNF
jgi:hypothetical protein